MYRNLSIEYGLYEDILRGPVGSGLSVSGPVAGPVSSTNSEIGRIRGGVSVSYSSCTALDLNRTWVVIVKYALQLTAPCNS